MLVAGSIFLGRIIEPVTSTSNPYAKMEMGIPFTRRPKALRFDYKVSMPAASDRVYSSGFGKKKTYKGHDSAEVYVLLQRRWEDATAISMPSVSAPGASATARRPPDGSAHTASPYSTATSPRIPDINPTWG